MSAFVKYTLPGIFVAVGVVLVAGSAVSMHSGSLAKSLDFEDKSETIASAEEVDSIDLDIDMGDVTILPGNEFRYEATNIDPDLLDVTVVGGNLKFEYGEQSWFQYMGFTSLFGTDTEIVVYMPQKLYEQMTIAYGAGDFSMKGVRVSKANITGGAGDFLAEDFRVEQSAEIDCGIGDVTFRNSTLVNPKIEAGVGELSFENCSITGMNLDAGVGDVDMENSMLLGDTEIECGVGDVDLALSGNPEEYYVDVDKGVGGFRSNDTGNQSAQNHMKIEGGVGDIEVNISQ